MKIVAIICEYNPFHNGHAAQLAHLRQRAGEDAAIVCIMSGCFTQRGEPAVLPPYDRARAALLCGVDLVLELPQPWASGSAEFFAAGGVAIADRLGCVDALSFGCESEDLTAPVRVAANLDSPAFAAAQAKDGGHPGEGEAARVARLYHSAFGDDEGMLSQPNNLLAVAYCRALRRRSSAIAPWPMKREGSGYAEIALGEGLPSAAAIRTALEGGADLESLAAYLPPSSLTVLREAIAAGRGPVTFSRLEQAVLAYYRLADADALADCASMRGGLNYRLCRAARTATSLDELFALAATRAYTNARIRRALLHGMLGVTEADLRAEPVCTLLLAASARGRELLRFLRRSSDLTIVTKPADLCRIEPKRAAQLRRRAENLYTLAMPAPMSGGEFVKCAPFFGG